MSLYKYHEPLFMPPDDIEVIRDNEVYFDSVTRKKVDKNVDILLQEVDIVKYFSKRYFTDRFGGNLYWSELSTGGKTILNVFLQPQSMFLVW